MVWQITFIQRDTLAGKLGAHRRIDIGIRTTHLHPPLAGKQCYTTHEGSTNTQDMYMHGSLVLIRELLSGELRESGHNDLRADQDIQQCDSQANRQ